MLSCLTGNAAASAAGYAVILENYSVVLGMLKSRYGDEKAIRRQLYAEPSPRAERETNVDNTVESLERVLLQLKVSGEKLEHPDIMETENKQARWMLLEIYQEQEHEET